MAQNPRQVPKVNLCRTYLETPDPVLQQQILAELNRRGLNPFDCPPMVQQQNQAAAALAAVALIGAAAAVCSNGCASTNTYYRPPPTYQGNCQYSWQRDAAGNLCGNRAASVRPGGYGGGYPAAPTVTRYGVPVTAQVYPTAPAPVSPTPLYTPPIVAPSAPSRLYITGPRGGCYYINGNGNKTYVDRSMCS